MRPIICVVLLAVAYSGEMTHKAVGSEGVGSNVRSVYLGGGGDVASSAHFPSSLLAGGDRRRSTSGSGDGTTMVQHPKQAYSYQNFNLHSQEVVHDQQPVKVKPVTKGHDYDYRSTKGTGEASSGKGQKTWSHKDATPVNTWRTKTSSGSGYKPTASESPTKASTTGLKYANSHNYKALKHQHDSLGSQSSSHVNHIGSHIASTGSQNSHRGGHVTNVGSQISHPSSQTSHLSSQVSHFGSQSISSGQTGSHNKNSKSQRSSNFGSKDNALQNKDNNKGWRGQQQSLGSYTGGLRSQTGGSGGQNSHLAGHGGRLESQVVDVDSHGAVGDGQSGHGYEEDSDDDGGQGEGDLRGPQGLKNKKAVPTSVVKGHLGGGRLVLQTENSKPAGVGNEYPGLETTLTCPKGVCVEIGDGGNPFRWWPDEQQNVGTKTVAHQDSKIQESVIQSQTLHFVRGGVGAGAGGLRYVGTPDKMNLGAIAPESHPSLLMGHQNNWRQLTTAFAGQAAAASGTVETPAQDWKGQTAFVNRQLEPAAQQQPQQRPRLLFRSAIGGGGHGDALPATSNNLYTRAEDGDNIKVSTDGTLWPYTGHAKDLLGNILVKRKSEDEDKVEIITANSKRPEEFQKQWGESGGNFKVVTGKIRVSDGSKPGTENKDASGQATWHGSSSYSSVGVDGDTPDQWTARGVQHVRAAKAPHGYKKGLVLPAESPMKRRVPGGEATSVGGWVNHAQSADADAAKDDARRPDWLRASMRHAKRHSRPDVDSSLRHQDSGNSPQNYRGDLESQESHPAIFTHPDHTFSGQPDSGLRSYYSFSSDQHMNSRGLA